MSCSLSTVSSPAYPAELAKSSETECAWHRKKYEVLGHRAQTYEPTFQDVTSDTLQPLTSLSSTHARYLQNRQVSLLGFSDIWPTGVSIKPGPTDVERTRKIGQLSLMTAILYGVGG